MATSRKIQQTKRTEVVLVNVRGPDGPGITAALTAVIAKSPGVRLLDIEQMVVHRKLMLSFLLAFGQHGRAQGPVLKELLFAAKELDVELRFEAFDDKHLGTLERGHQYAVTCLGADVGANPLSRISQALAERGVNIDKIGKLSTTNLSCVELLVRAARPLDHRKLTQGLLGLATELEIDIAIQPASLLRRAKRLIVFDMDSTLIQTEVIDELGREARVGKKMANITAKAMQGTLAFNASLKARVRLLEGLSEQALDRVYRRIKLTPGATRLIRVLKHLGFRTAVISGGFTYFTDRLQQRLGLDYAFANDLEIKTGKLTGRVRGEIVDSRRKALILETLAKAEGISLDQIIAVGDGANDLPMLSKAGLGIAFHAHEDVRRRAAHGLSHRHDLASILYLLGISERDLATMGM